MVRTDQDVPVRLAPAASSRRTVPVVLPIAVIGLAAALIVLFGLLRLWWAELVLVPATVLLIYSSVEASWEQLSDPAERLARGVRRWLRSAAHHLGVRVAARRRRAGVWLAARGRQAEVWVEVRTQQVPVRRRHHQVLHSLGQAVYSGDEARTAAHRMAAATTGARLDHLERRLALVREHSDERVRRGRAATDATLVLPTPEARQRAPVRERR